jgi:osmotically-inducible protein OsmY
VTIITSQARITHYGRYHLVWQNWRAGGRNNLPRRSGEIIMVESGLADQDILESVEDAINDLDFARESRAVVFVAVQDGVVTLTGVVLTGIMRRAALVRAAKAPGVVKVIDRLVTDTDLVAAVSQALAADLRTRLLRPAPLIRSYRGEVILTGKADDAPTSEAARIVAADVPGVRRVVNRISAPSQD